MTFLIVAILIATTATAQAQNEMDIDQIMTKYDANSCRKSTSPSCDLGTPVRNLPPGKPLNIVLLGKTGHGKSATANAIFGDKRFESRMSTCSVTSKCQMEVDIIGGREIRLVDTPGTMDTRRTDKALNEITTAIALSPQGFDAFVFVLPINVRITEDEIHAITMLKALFGKDVISKYGIFVFTHGDAFEESMSFQEYIKSQEGDIKTLLEECNYRCTLIDNSQKDPGILRDQVIQIIKLIDEVVDINKGVKYTNDMFEVAQKELHQAQKRLEEEKAELERKRQEEIDAYIKKEITRNVEEEMQKMKEEYEAKLKVIEKDYEKKVQEAASKVSKYVETTKPYACFPPDALVTLDDGRTITIANLSIGDKVLSGTATRTLEYSEVYMFAHFNQYAISEYINLRSLKQNVNLSPKHHIYIVRNGQVKSIAAGKVEIGDSMIVLNKESYFLVDEPVTKIRKFTDVGVYAPITMSGTIIVNNILASCYVDIVPPIYSHPMLWPMRMLYRLSPSLAARINAEGKGGMPIWIQYIMDNILA